MTAAIRALTQGILPSDVEDLKNDAAAPPRRIFERAVVIDVLADPANRSEEDALLTDMRGNIADDYFTAPRNSILTRIINDGRGKAPDNFICYPFFSSHFALPVKPGEQVWIFFESLGEETTQAFWLSRIAEAVFVEDPNYTHGDRRYSRDAPSQKEAGADDGSGNPPYTEPRNLKFPNGASPVDFDAQTLSYKKLKADQQVDAYATLVQDAKEKSYTIEPVPRLTKRPGDLVVQGSNNTAVILGTDRGWDVSTRPNESLTSNSVAAAPSLLKRGAIDIVAGRGRYFQSSDAINGKLERPNNSTRPQIAKNTKGFETDKNIAVLGGDANKGNLLSNPTEGDPDFLVDAARVYVSEQSKIDIKLGTFGQSMPKPFEGETKAVEGSAVAVKSDHIRIVARKTKIKTTDGKEPDEVADINGTIRIVKEGNPGEDLAMISIAADGTIFISGAKIFFGRQKDDKGAGTGPGPGESQPYVKYQQLEDLLTKTYDNLIDFITGLQTNFGTNATPGFGGPNPALIKTGLNECTQALTALNSRKSEIKEIKSARIFGE